MLSSVLAFLGVFLYLTFCYFRYQYEKPKVIEIDGIFRITSGDKFMNRLGEWAEKRDANIFNSFESAKEFYENSKKKKEKKVYEL